MPLPLQVLQQMVLAVPGTPRQNITGAFFANGEPVTVRVVALVPTRFLTVTRPPSRRAGAV